MSHFRIDEQAAEYYHKNGYYLFDKPLFPQEKFERLVAIFEELVEAREAGIRTDELDTPHLYDPRLFEFLMADEVLDLVAPIIGSNIGLWSSHFIAKEPLIGRATPWHEDSAFWNGRFDRMDQIVTVWLAIDKSDRENGCMRVIPGTHQNGFSDYEDVDQEQNTFGSEIRSDLVDESKAVYFELEPGYCSLHDSRLMHGAEANTSPRRRAGYTMRYFSMDMIFNTEHKSNQKHKIWLCRGENVANNPVEPMPETG